jgi:hypothetical protein
MYLNRWIARTKLQESIGWRLSLLLESGGIVYDEIPAITLQFKCSEITIEDWIDLIFMCKEMAYPQRDLKLGDLEKFCDDPIFNSLVDLYFYLVYLCPKQN